MSYHLCRGWTWALLIAASVSCEKPRQSGLLQVIAAAEGGYEIYRIANESPLQFISEQAGQFNQDIPLAPGSYLVLADCSSETVIIHPGAREVLVAHRIVFLPPHAPTKQDGFSIQCSRSDKTRSRQHIANRFELNVLHGKRDLLVGMVPLRVDFDAAAAERGQPASLSYKLSSLQIEALDGRDEEASYFVSPVDELTSVTKSQTFGHWEFLLPGSYVLEVNGTKMEVALAEGEERVVKPARLSVTTSPDVDLAQAVKVRGSPWLVEINGEHSLNFNEVYPVLPGKAVVGVSSSTQSLDVDLSEGGSVELKARSVRVDLACSPGEALCTGEKAVSLYRAEEPYPFVESVSDIPIIYLEEKVPILVGVEGSRDITYELPVNERDRRLTVGFVKLMPQPTHRAGQTTDLVRIEANNAPLSGNTLDINLEHATLMPLIAGSYQLSHHLSLATVDSDRRSATQTLTIEPGKTVEMSFPVYFNEKRFAAWKKKSEGKG